MIIHIFTMKEFDEFTEEQFYNLMPELFINDTERYLRVYGTINYTRFGDVIVVEEKCLIQLNDGNKLNYQNKHIEIHPQFLNSWIN